MDPRLGEARLLLRSRLETRRSEIEQTILTRVHSLADPAIGRDPEYAQSLRAAVVAALEYGLAGIEEQGGLTSAVPTQLLFQARLAARNRVSLETVLRRYFAGYTLLGDFLIEEAGGGGLLEGAELKRLLRAQAARFDRLVAAVSEEHTRELHERLDGNTQRRAEQVERLLAGELLGNADLGYEFDCWHLGAIASGAEAAEALRELSTALDRRLLLVNRGGDVVWAWFGGRQKVDGERVEHHISQRWPKQLSLAIGEPGKGLAGWRLTHRQAAAALPIALLSQRANISYGEVALLASMIQDDLLLASLHQVYLKPLEGERDGGTAARETLRAYFAADRNISSAAAALRAPRNTIASRLQAIEERLGRPFSVCAVELEVVIRLDELAERADGHAARQFTDIWRT